MLNFFLGAQAGGVWRNLWACGHTSHLNLLLFLLWLPGRPFPCYLDGDYRSAPPLPHTQSFLGYSGLDIEVTPYY